MSRDIDHDGREPSPISRSGAEQGVERLSMGLRRPIDARGRTFQLRPSELAALRQVGTFRVVDARDLERFLYGGNRTASRQDLRSLASQGLMRRHTIAGQRHGARLAVVSLTREGAAVARQTVADSQAIYDGFVKPREVPHDAALYRMYQAEAARIEGTGGRVQRVVLDYELKRQVQHDLQAAGADGAARRRAPGARGVRPWAPNRGRHDSNSRPAPRVRDAGGRRRPRRSRARHGALQALPARGQGAGGFHNLCAGVTGRPDYGCPGRA